MWKVLALPILIVVCVTLFWVLFGGWGEGSSSKSNEEAARIAEEFSRGATQQATGATAQGQAQNTVTNNTNKKYMYANVTTNMGRFKIELFQSAAPKTVENFTTLASSGFYNGTKFHRVIAGFMIQGGDPLSKDDSMSARWGTGGPGYTFEDEIHAENRNAVGTISMANAGPNTNGSQFFINVADNNFLDTKHTVFGRVVEGLEVVQDISRTDTGQNDRPMSPIVIESITLE